MFLCEKLLIQRVCIVQVSDSIFIPSLKWKLCDRKNKFETLTFLKVKVKKKISTPFMKYELHTHVSAEKTKFSVYMNTALA